MKLLYTLLFYTLASMIYSAAAESCPDKEDIYPCFCKFELGDADVLCHGLSTVAELKKVVEGIKGFKIYKMTISTSNISNVPNDIFQGADITRLDIIESDITTAGASGEPQLVGLEKSLKILNVFGHQSPTEEKRPFGALSLGNLETLFTLHVEFNYIPILGNDWFEKGPTSLKMLVFFANDIEKLEDKVFAELEQLDYLMVSSNFLTAVSRSMFPKRATHLESLKLDRNKLKDLPEDFFSDMPALKTVDFYDNEFTTISESTWSAVWDQLDFINFFINPMECDSRIKWITQSGSIFFKISGYCVKPKELEGKALALLITSDFE